MITRFLTVAALIVGACGLQACSSASTTSNTALTSQNDVQPGFMVIKESPYSAQETLAILAQHIASQGGLVLAQLDQPSQRVNQAGYIAPTHVLVFQIEAREGRENPMRVMAWEDGQTTYLVYTLHDPQSDENSYEARLETLTDEVISG